MILGKGCVTVVESLFWAHYMMAAGLHARARAYMLAVTTVFVVATGNRAFYV